MMRSRYAGIAVCVLTLVALTSLAAGCGGSAAPSVASLGTSGADTSTSSDGGSAAGPSASGSSGPSLALKIGNGRQFSACMRSHGEPNFPDPGNGGGIQVGPGSGVDPSSPKFQAAQRACQKLLPNGGQPSPQQRAKMQAALLAFSACMRSHGVPDFPDPTFPTGGGAEMKVGGGPGSDLNPNSPRFQAAQTACQGKLPGNVKVGARSTTGGK